MLKLVIFVIVIPLFQSCTPETAGTNLNKNNFVLGNDIVFNPQVRNINIHPKTNLKQTNIHPMGDKMRCYERYRFNENLCAKLNIVTTFHLHIYFGQLLSFKKKNKSMLACAFVPPGSGFN